VHQPGAEREGVLPGVGDQGDAPADLPAGHSEEVELGGLDADRDAAQLHRGELPEERGDDDGEHHESSRFCSQVVRSVVHFMRQAGGAS
jgi:hypothetical protein